MTRQMKILQVCSAQSLGGGERHVIDLSQALVERGHEVHLAVRPNSPLREIKNSLPFQWHELGLRNALDIRSGHQLASIIQAEGIEILHAHLARDYTFCGIAARMAHPVHFYITRHHFNPIKSNPVYSWTLSEARALIAVSESVREQLALAFPALVDRIVVIPNWVGTRAVRYLSREEAREKLGITRRLSVGIIGQITPLKRHDLFVRAAAHMVRERHWSEVDFLIIGEPGPDDEAYAAELNNLVSQSGIVGNLRFTGFIEDLPSYLPALDMVVAPSENEAFSLAVVEAMAAGCAVIASRVGGMAEIIEDGVTGLFIEQGELWSLIFGMSKFFTDKELRNRVGAAAQASVMKKFDRENVIDRIEQLYLGGIA
jgi:glycosyltransferase involved in cell wall biosynthesis